MSAISTGRPARSLHPLRARSNVGTLLFARAATVSGGAAVPCDAAGPRPPDARLVRGARQSLKSGVSDATAGPA